MSFTSKFRHIYGDAAKGKDQYSDIKNALTSGESQYIKANPRFWAYGKSAGGAPVYIKLLSEVGRAKTGAKYISTHKGRLTDFDFHPFIDTLIATAADDCKVNVNAFPKDGLTENITKAEIELKGHRKKISLIKFNPAVNAIIASASYDRTVKVWNIETGETIMSYDGYKDNIYSVDWNKDGSLLGTTSKDRVLRIYDPRKTDEAVNIEDAFGGIKSTKCFFINGGDNFKWIGSTGFSKSAKRELKMWDLRNTAKPIYNQGLDNQASVLIPHMDSDLNILYLAGKGDNSTSYHEIRNDSKICHFLSVYRDSTPQKGGGWVPKRGLEVMKCEVQRYLKLTKDSVIPISFIVPRKSGSEVFQEDIYPQCAAPKAATTASDWVGGANNDPVTMSMDPDEQKGDDYADEYTKKKTYDEVVAENQALLQKIAALEAELSQYKGGGGGDDAADENKEADTGDYGGDDEQQADDQ